MQVNPENYLDDNGYEIPLEWLREWSRLNPSDGMIRFLNGMEDKVFGVFHPEPNDKIHLFYAEYSREYRCFCVPVPVEDYKLANDVTVVFSARLSAFNSDLDFFNVFNTFQHYRQSSLELQNYFTFDPNTSPEGTLVTIGRKIIPVERLQRLAYLRTLYENVVDKPHLDPLNKIYLMLDDTNGLIKIGRSKNPKVRERTLQSEKPKTYILAAWTAPIQVEKELHNRYDSKKQRGEWFRLTINDLCEIKEYMDSL
jgi:hypothetical protein